MRLDAGITDGYAIGIAADVLKHLDLWKGKSMQSRIIHGMEIALEAVDEVLELGLCGLRYTRKKELQILIYISLGK